MKNVSKRLFLFNSIQSHNRIDPRTSTQVYLFSCRKKKKKVLDFFKKIIKNIN